MASKPTTRVPAFREAIRFFRSRVLRTDDILESLTDAEYSQAFFVSGASELDLVTHVWKALDRAIARGTSFETFKRAVSKELTKAWGEEKPYRIETIFRTNVQTAYNAGRWEQLNDPATAQVRPLFKFLAVLDTRTTLEICRPIADTILPREHPFWRSHWPPLHFQCRSTVLSLTEAQGDKMGRSRRAPQAQAAEGFGKSPDQRGYVPDTSGSPPQLVQALKTR